MNVVVALEHRFDRTPDGAVWTQTMFAYPFWIRYLEVFTKVCVVARVREVLTAPSNWKRADGEGVDFAPVPYYLGPWQYLKKLKQIEQSAIAAIGANDAVILRVSSAISDCIEPMLHKTHHPFGVEVVGDPYDVFAPGSIKHPFRPFFRWLFPRILRRQCSRAVAASYVTEFALQKRYPPAPSAFSTHYSSIELSDSDFISVPRFYPQGKRMLKLIFLGTLAQLYKGPDILIDSVAICVRDGLNLQLIMIGDGKHRAELEIRAANLGLEDRVFFLGQLSAGDEVQKQLDQADLFVLASHQEGLPRAMIEAMARGLPCIGSTVGGIPELLPCEDMIPPRNVNSLATIIREVVTNQERMTFMSARNLEKAKEYREEVLRDRRIKFYRYVRERTEEWSKVNQTLRNP